MGEPLARVEALEREGRLIEALRALYSLPEGDLPAAAPAAVWLWRSAGNLEKAVEWAERGGGEAPEELRLAWERARAEEAARLRANLEAAGRGNVFSPALERWLADPAFDARTTWARAGAGIVWLRERPAGAGLEVLAEPVSAEEAAAAAKASQSGLPAAVFGSCTGRLEAVLAKEPQILLWMKRAVYVIEPDLDLFLLSLRLADRRRALASPDCFWFVGPEWAEAMQQTLVRERMLPFPDARSPSVAAEALPVSEKAARILWADHLRAKARFSSDYEGRSRSAWAAALRGADRPARVLFITSRFTTVLQHVVADLSRAFAHLGCATETVIERRDCERFNGPALACAVDAFRPDLVVQLDHIRPELGDFLPDQVPFACWIQDRLPSLFQKDLIARLGPRDLTFAMWEGIRRDCLAAGYPSVERLSAAADAFVYGGEAKARQELACDVAFVSNLSSPRPEPRYPRLVERAVGILSSEGIGWRDPAFYGRLLARLEKELGLRVAEADRGRIETQVLAFDVERYVQRTEPVRWAAALGCSVGVWGSGWEGIPDLRKAARGRIAPGADLRDLYRSARIHLHMNSDTNVHQRVFECLASGGFVLAAAHPGDRAPGGLAEHLAIGREIETFDGKAGFEEKVRRYLADEPARRAVSAAGRARVLAEHTTAHRAETILDRARALFSAS